MKKNLMDSQKELLLIKNQGVQNALTQARALQAQLEGTVKRIAIELGVEENDYINWNLSSDGSYFEKPSGEKK